MQPYTKTMLSGCRHCPAPLGTSPVCSSVGLGAERHWAVAGLCEALAADACCLQGLQKFVQPRVGASLTKFPLELCREMHSALKEVFPPGK